MTKAYEHQDLWFGVTIADCVASSVVMGVTYGVCGHVGFLSVCVCVFVTEACVSELCEVCTAIIKIFQMAPVTREG